MTTPEGTLVTARNLTDALNGMTRRLEEAKQASEERDEVLGRYGRRNRILVIAAIVGFVLDVTATSVAFVAYAGVLHAQTQIRRNGATVAQLHTTSLSACRAGNARLARQQGALDSILTLGPVQPGQTAAQRALAKKLLAIDRAKVAKGWAPRNCQQIYKLGR